MFATALDAVTSFDDKIVELEDFGFMLQPPMVDRVLRVLDEMRLYIPDRQTGFDVNRSCKVQQATVWGTPTLASDACVYVVVNKTETEPEDVLSTAMYLGIHGVEYGYISNLCTGTLTQVHVPLGQHGAFMEHALALCSSTETDLEDTAFVQHHQYTRSEETG